MLLVMLISLLSLISSYILVGLLRKWAEQRQILDIPNQRSSHTRPTPRGGGIGIVFPTLVGIIIYAIISQKISLWTVTIYAVNAFIIAIVSGLDDIKPLSNSIRFFTQSACALGAIWGLALGESVHLPLIGVVHWGWMGLLLTFFWIVGLTNAYNFMDGIDGIAGSQAVVAGLGWAIFGWWSHQTFVMAVGLLIATTSLGFLNYNWPPARIFMGDVGSAFLGYSFAILTLVAAKQSELFALVGLLLLWPFLFDTTFTILRRCRNKENIFVAHRSHIYQRLVITGYSHAFVTIIYLCLELVGLVLAFVCFFQLAMSLSITVFILLLLAVGLWFFVFLQERKSFAHIPRLTQAP